MNLLHFMQKIICIRESAFIWISSCKLLRSFRFFVSAASSPKQQTPKAEATVNMKNVTCNGKRNIRQLIRVTPVGSGNPRSILLPVNLKDMKEVRTIKIINASQARNLKGFKINQGSVISKAIPVSLTRSFSFPFVPDVVVEKKRNE